MSYAYIGGVIGENDGIVLSGNNYEKSNGMVKIISFSGSNGGIVGRGNEYSVVTGRKSDTTDDILSTGKNWTIEARCTATDTGTGGVVGNLYSASPMEYVKNYATVKNVFNGNTSVGGICGRVEFNYLTSIQFRECENHGNVTACRRVGGIVGVMKGKGGYYNGCRNYGTIYSYADYASGILGNTFSITSGIYFDSCENYGDVSILNGKGCGGILGQYQEVSNDLLMMEIHFANCLNVSTISANSNYGGICGRSNKKTYFHFCRNYYSTKECTIAGKPFSGSYERIDGAGDYNYSESANRNDYQQIDAVHIDTWERAHRRNDGISLTAPVGSIYTDNGQYHLSWRNIVNQNPWKYGLIYKIYNSKGQELFTSDEQVITGREWGYFDILQVEKKQKQLGNNTTVRFFVRAINNKMNRYDSPWSGAIKLSKAEALATPQFHIEMVSPTKAVFILDNIDDYLDNANGKYKDAKIEFDIYSSEGKLNKTVTSKLNDGKGVTSAFDLSTSVASNYTVIAQVKANVVAYTDSAEASYYGSLLGGSDFKNASFSSHQTTFEGFYGVGMEDLTYRIKYNANERDIYVMSDLVAEDEELLQLDNSFTIPVSLAYGITHVASRTGDSSFTTTLKNLPSDLIGKDIRVRSYLHAGQGNMVHLGHVVAENITKEELAKYLNGQSYDLLYLNSSGKRVTNQTIASKLANGKLALKNGYIVCKNENGTYSIYYNASLSMYADALVTNSNNHYMVLEEMYSFVTRDEHTLNNHYDSSGEKKWDVQPVPYIAEDGFIYERDLQKDCMKYTFQWDNSVNQGATYKVELFGETVMGERVSLASQTVSGTPILRVWDEDNNWNYVLLDLEVTRLGVTDNQRTILLPRTSTRIFSLKNKLSTITIPSVALLESQEGGYNKDDLLYQIGWNGISDINERKDLGGYLIRLQKSDRSRIEYIYVQELQDEDAMQAGETIDLSFLKDENGNLVSNLYDYTSKYQPDINSLARSLVIDLSRFAANDQVEISVVAVSRTHSANYTYGEQSEAYALTVPSRISAPNVEKLSCNLTYDLEHPMSIAALNAVGIELQMLDEAYTGYDAGHYYIAMDIVTHANESSEVLCEILRKSDRTVMNGTNLMSANYRIEKDDLSDFAGKWLRVSLKAVSDSAIGSLWTDEDDRVQSYYYVHIPPVRLDEVLMSSSTETNYYDADQKLWYINNPNELIYAVERKTVSFSMGKYCNQYLLTIAPIDEGRDAVSYLFVKDALNGISVYAKNTENGLYEIYVGTITEDNTIELLDSQSFVLEEFNLAGAGFDEELTLTSYAYLSDENTVTIVLPDIAAYGKAGAANISIDKYLFTKYVEILQQLDIDMSDYIPEDPKKYYLIEQITE